MNCPYQFRGTDYGNGKFIPQVLVAIFCPDDVNFLVNSIHEMKLILTIPCSPNNLLR
jgi:hypothetical protein